MKLIGESQISIPTYIWVESGRIYNMKHIGLNDILVRLFRYSVLRRLDEAMAVARTLHLLI